MTKMEWYQIRGLRTFCYQYLTEKYGTNSDIYLKPNLTECNFSKIKIKINHVLFVFQYVFFRNNQQFIIRRRVTYLELSSFIHLPAFLDKIYGDLIQSMHLQMHSQENKK